MAANNDECAALEQATYFPPPIAAVLPRQRRFRYSLRAVLLAVLIIAIPLEWFSLQLKWIRSRHQALETLSPHGTYEVVPYWVPGPKPADYRPAPPTLRMFHEQGIANIFVWSDEPDCDQRIEALEKLFPESLVKRRARVRAPN